MIHPTIGRVVWFKDETLSNQFMPALISYVHNKGLVNLAAHLPDGTPYPRTNVVLFQGDSEECPNKQCCWMPYQQQQVAAKETKGGTNVKSKS